VPLRGDKRALHQTVTRNAAEDLARHRLKRAGDHNARSRALTELQAALGLRQAPLRIECFDMSHLQGTNYVGSMVVFEDALAKKSDYRRFKVNTVPGNDDYAAMEEVLRRRLSNLLADRDRPVVEPATEESAEDIGRRRAAGRRRFAYSPQLLVLDGGKGQLGVGVRVLAELGLTGEIELAALAKQFEEVFRPGVSEPIRIPRGSEALYLLQRVRDEAHRFAITFHRERRAKSMTASALEGIPGLGPTRAKRLLAHAGSLKALRGMSRDELRSLSWLPDPVAEAVFARLLVGGAPGVRSLARPRRATAVGPD